MSILLFFTRTVLLSSIKSSCLSSIGYKNILIRRKESDTYLATVRRHRWSLQVAMKEYKILSSFIVTCRLQRCLLTVARKVSLSFLLINIFLIILPFQVFLLYWYFPHMYVWHLERKIRKITLMLFTNTCDNMFIFNSMKLNSSLISCLKFKLLKDFYAERAVGAY